jgi:hypothetical protein
MELKEIHSALKRAVESGDALTIGIVLGQTLVKLEKIINEQSISNKNNVNNGTTNTGNPRSSPVFNYI